MQTLSPVQAKDRILFMDVLRGAAILGIFLANLAAFSWYRADANVSGPFIVPYLDRKVEFLYAMFLDGKFYSIFSLLFGWGIALQVKKGVDKGISAIPIIKRRLAFMLLFGALHLLIWPGDIVFFYAMLGFILLPFRRFSNKTLLITGGIFILLPILLYAAKMRWPVVNAPSQLLFQTGFKADLLLNGVQSEEEFVNIIRNGNWWQILKGHMAGFFFRYGDLFFVSRIWKVLEMFLVGYVVGRSQFYAKVQNNRRLLYPFILIGLLIGLPANYILAYVMTEFAAADYFQLKITGLYRTIAYALGVAPLAIAYASILALHFQFAWGKFTLNFLAPVGKMAFSNYVLQSLIGNYVFLGAGLGYLEKVGPLYYTFFGVLVFIGQVILSTIWLRYFNYGPIEWLWRSGTYGQWQKMSKRQLMVST